MALIGKVHPDCVNVANPYHECTENCLRKIAEGKGRKNKKKTGYCLIHYLILTLSVCLPPPTFFFPSFIKSLPKTHYQTAPCSYLGSGTI